MAIANKLLLQVPKVGVIFNEIYNIPLPILPYAGSSGIRKERALNNTWCYTGMMGNNINGYIQLLAVIIKKLTTI